MDSQTSRQRLAVLVTRLGTASAKLDLVTEHWRSPMGVTTEDRGAVALIRDVAHELDSVYCALEDWASNVGLIPKMGLAVDHFLEQHEIEESNA